MTDILCKRMGPALQGETEADAEAIRAIPFGETVKVSFTRPRNLAFHRKWFALLRFGFDNFEPEIDESFEAKYGMTPETNFERFRKDVTILAGYFEAHVNIKNEVRVEAKSVKFGSMSEEDFAELYKKTINVLWTRVFERKGYSEEELTSAAAQLGDFD